MGWLVACLRTGVLLVFFTFVRVQMTLNCQGSSVFRNCDLVAQLFETHYVIPIYFILIGGIFVRKFPVVTKGHALCYLIDFPNPASSDSQFVLHN